MKKIIGYAAALFVLTFAYPVLRLDGHAILLTTAPAFNESVHGPLVHVKLRFSSRIDMKRSRLILVLPGGGERTLPADQPSPDTIKSEVAKLVPGHYVLRWQVLAEDGHITRGELPFSTQ